MASIEREDMTECKRCGQHFEYVGHVGIFHNCLCGLCLALQEFDHDTDPCLYTFDENDDEEDGDADDSE